MGTVQSTVPISWVDDSTHAKVESLIGNRIVLSGVLRLLYIVKENPQNLAIRGLVVMITINFQVTSAGCLANSSTPSS